jgi:LSD1 subclass zinc finger protein
MPEPVDVRCPNCRRLLFRIIGAAWIEIKCEKCKALIAIRPGAFEIVLARAWLGEQEPPRIAWKD